ARALLEAGANAPDGISGRGLRIGVVDVDLVAVADFHAGMESGARVSPDQLAVGTVFRNAGEAAARIDGDRHGRGTDDRCEWLGKTGMGAGVGGRRLQSRGG